MLVATPTLVDPGLADIEQLSPDMVHGAFHGGNRGPAFSGPLRDVGHDPAKVMSG